jgi:mannosyltransferase
MKIFFDNIIYGLQVYGGISKYFNEIKKVESDLDLIVEQNDIKPYVKNRVKRELSKLSKCHLPNYQNIDIFHSSYYRIPDARDIPSVVTVHDFAHEHGHVSNFSSMMHSLFLKRRAINHASKIICISESTKSDLVKFYPDVDEKDVHVVYNGLSTIYKSLDIIIESIYRKYCLFVGSRAGYKNFNDAVQSIQLISNIKLYIVGGGIVTKSEMLLLNKLIPGRYIIISNVTDEKLKSLYRNSICLLYPSLYEGFGIPIIEAFSQGCPVIIYDNPACVEISKGAALVCSSGVPFEISEYIKHLALEDEYSDFNNIIKISGLYDWKLTRSKNKSIYQQCL